MTGSHVRRESFAPMTTVLFVSVQFDWAQTNQNHFTRLHCLARKLIFITCYKFHQPLRYSSLVYSYMRAFPYSVTVKILLVEREPANKHCKRRKAERSPGTTNFCLTDFHVNWESWGGLRTRLGYYIPFKKKVYFGV